MMSSSMRVLLAASLPCLLLAIPINNGIDGDPEVQCGPTSVQISFQTQAPFEGVVYAKNHYGQDECQAAGSPNGVAQGGIEIGFEQCNSQRFRSLDPRGVFVTLTVVVQFHQSVLTKVDRAFHIRCFYMEADKTVDQQLEVSMVTTDLVTLTVPMPVCRYDIFAADANGNLDPALRPVQFALIGDKIVHKWTCDSETVDTFCMEVYSCYVDDQQGGQPLDLVDENGCSLDGNLVPNPQYPTDLMAEAPAHVFKWADRPALYFNCQVRIGIKEPGSDCQAWRDAEPANGPNGPCQGEPLTLGRKKRSAPALGRRPGQSLSSPGVQEMDLAPERPVYVGDLELTQEDLPRPLRSLAGPFAPSAAPAAPQTGVCMSTNQVGVMFALLALLFVAATGLSAAVFLRRTKN